MRAKGPIAVAWLWVIAALAVYLWQFRPLLGPLAAKLGGG